MVILRAQEEVDEEDCDGCTSDNHDPVAQEEEAKHIVHLAKPHVIQYEE